MTTQQAARSPFRLAMGMGTVVMVGFLALPLLSLVGTVRPGALIHQLSQPTVLQALRLSMVTSLAATGLVVIFGLPSAYYLATRDFRGKRIIELLVYMPMVLPPTVAGFALLLAFGRAGLAGNILDLAGIHLPFTTLGVVVAQAFMAAPFFIAPTRAAIAAVDPRFGDIAATLGASKGYIFRRVTIPLILPALVAAGGMCWARALGEFGATITFAGNLPGTTQTMPLAVYLAMQTDFDAARTLSLLLVGLSLALLIALQFTSVGLFAQRSVRASH